MGEPTTAVDKMVSYQSIWRVFSPYEPALRLRGSGKGAGSDVAPQRRQPDQRDYDRRLGDPNVDYWRKRAGWADGDETTDSYNQPSNRRHHDRRLEDANVEYWRQRAGWADDDKTMTSYNEGVYNSYYNSKAMFQYLSYCVLVLTNTLYPQWAMMTPAITAWSPGGTTVVPPPNRAKTLSTTLGGSSALPPPSSFSSCSSSAALPPLPRRHASGPPPSNLATRHGPSVTSTGSGVHAPAPEPRAGGADQRAVRGPSRATRRRTGSIA